MKIENIIFDIGNVLVDFCWEKHLSKLGFTGEIYDRVATATVLDELWNISDQGIYSEEEMLEKFISNDPGVENEIRAMYADLSSIVETFPYANEWIRQLKNNGYKVYALSNYSAKAYRECSEKLKFLNEMDGAVLSFQEKKIKPYRDIYNVLLERYNLNPASCVFLDDRSDNIATAVELGMKGVVFTSRFDAVKQLQKLGVNT